jgi:hypothetical protein
VGGNERTTNFWARSPRRRVFAGLVLAAAAVVIIMIFNYTGGRSSFIKDGCEIPASDAMLNAVHSVKAGHPVSVTAQTVEPFHDRRFLVTETGNTISIEDVARAEVVCSFPVGS